MKYTLYAILCFLTGAVSYELDLKKLKDQAFAYHKTQRLEAWRQCSVSPQLSLKTEYGRITGPKIVKPKTRGPRSTDTNRNTAVLLTSNIGTLVREDDAYGVDVIPTQEFSVEVWVKPEGGQADPAIILKSEDVCNPFPNKGWKLGIKIAENYKERNARFFFGLETARSRFETEIISPFNYKPGEWVYIVATYDRRIINLYINGAKVAVSDKQKGDVFPPSDSSCLVLHLGGFENNYFRGIVDDLRIWNSVLQPKDFMKFMNLRKSVGYSNNVLFIDTFDTLDQWEWSGPNAMDNFGPLLVTSDLSFYSLTLQFQPPTCGFTLCDVPDIVQSYNFNWELRSKKRIRYRVINIYNSDGSNPTVTEEQITKQHRALELAFSPYNISWELNQESVYNSTLRSRTIIFGCSPQKVGDKQCNPECQFSATGNDGGDCDKEISDCSFEELGNGICDSECNNYYNNWDNGDCCETKNADKCIDPSSPNRIYLDIEEYKSLLNFNNSKYVNILFAHWIHLETLGIATLPWEKDVYTEYGGVVVKPDEFGITGKLDTLIHELGHVLGLWHVHRGVTELNCHHRCFENEPKMDVGDLCEDTNPTPENNKCEDPSHEIEKCGFSKFINTPFTNYMSYTECPDSFTDQQTARMHCYIDLKYQMWKEETYMMPAPPIAPRIIASTSSNIKLTWLPPLSNIIYDNADCSRCTKDLELIQFAHTASSNENSFTDIWHPSQATGPPDAEICSPSYKAWSPDSSCIYEDCVLTLHFKVPVVPTLLSIWVVWNARFGLKEVEIVFTDDSNLIISDKKSYCDVPLTIPLSVEKEVKMVHLKTNSSFISVDAVQIISTPNQISCAPCKPLRYTVFRTPQFKTGLNQDVDINEFIDNEIKLGTVFTYRVQAWLGIYFSDLSPPLIFQHGSGFCGNGKIDKNEECDDGNIMNNDGCNMKCTIEKHYKCYDEPSLCYWYNGDGVCEKFEIESSVRDCGYYTPSNFIDQWAMSADTSYEFYNRNCLPDVVVGSPVKPEVCGSEPNPEISWYPCEDFADTEYWLVTEFSKPVVATSVFLYLGSDGQQKPYNEDSNRAVIHLINTKNTVHYSKHTLLSCSHNPYELKIFHDLSKPFHLTSKVNITFSSSNIAISAVRIRSAKYLNPVTISTCSHNELYSPNLQKCVTYNCNKPICSEPMSKNSQLVCSGYEEGDICNITCDVGYFRITNNNFITCINSEWVGADTNCKPLDCGSPMISHADVSCPDGTTLGKICNFKCIPPARLKGKSTIGMVKCDENGYWSTTNAPCQLMCTSPSSPPNSVRTSHHCRTLDTLQYGRRCSFRCKVGYHVIGHSIRKRNFYLVCSIKGSWKGPSCVPIICPPLEYFQDYKCTNGFLAGSECVINCQGQKISTRCGFDGKWEQLPNACLNVTKCIDPVLINRDVWFGCDAFSTGGTCKVLCTQRNKEIMIRGENYILEKIICTDQGTWSPDPKNLMCRAKSKIKNNEDPFQDSSTNKAH